MQGIGLETILSKKKKLATSVFFAFLAIFESNRRKRIIKNIPVQFNESG